MADPISSSAAGPRDTTFRFFSSEQGNSYAKHRLTYHPSLYQIILEHHVSTGGQLGTILDVGCGPGLAVRDLAPHFAHAVAIDPSAGMIAAARSLGGVSSSQEPIRFEISAAEELGADISPPVRPGSVDLVTAATAAHWFDMPKFWPRAAEVLKPGGTVAIWCSGNAVIKPSTPNAAAVMAAFDRFRDKLEPYLNAGNLLARELYVGMPLPWTLDVPVAAFDESTYVRREWNTEGSAQSLDFYANAGALSMDAMEKLFGTLGPVTRWREAHPEAVGTEHDIVRITRREVEAALHEAGVEKGEELVDGAAGSVLMLVKKRFNLTSEARVS